MTAGVIAEAAGLFTVTNLDDIVILSLFFAQGAGQPGSARRVIAGQYLAFTAILAVAIAVTFGVRFLPKEAVPYLGLLPIALGLRDAWKAWQNRKPGDRGEQAESGQGGPTVLKVATTTFANGGDNIGVYVPVFTNVGTSGTIVYCVVFLVLVGVWCAAGRFVATRPVIAKPLGQPGFISLRLHRAVSADAQYRWVNVANWESEAHFRAAHGTDEFRSVVTQPGWEEFPSSPMLYQVITETS